MEKYSLVLLLAVLLSPDYSYALGPAPIPPCPCDTAVLSNGLTGNEIVDIVCPGGTLGDDSSFFVSPDQIAVFLENPPNTTYRTRQLGPGNQFCEINSDGPLAVTLNITNQEYELCRIRLINGCNLDISRPIPTLSEWGLIALAGILGIVGLIAIRKKYASV